MQAQQEKSRPEIKVWAPSPDADAEQHATMKKLADMMPEIEPLLAKHGMTGAEFVPATTSREPDPGMHYKMHSSPHSQYLNDGDDEIIRAIHDRTQLAGTSHGPLNERQRELLKRDHKLTVKWSANTHDKDMSHER